ncbi:MAG: dihydroorotase [bacterium]|nr:dihydroorotase [Candidatus Margulisiibacteriota bacterium]
MAKILIKNGRIVDPASNLDEKKDLLIVDGKISKIGTSLKVKGAKIVDAKGMLVLPGLIDMHTHLRDPGRPDKETIASGTRAAALGGFTSVCCMANTAPAIDTPAVVKYILDKARVEGVVNVLPVAAVTRGLKGEALTEMGLLAASGAIAFSDDGQPIVHSDMMRRALEYARQFKALVISHCEDQDLSAGGSMNEGALATKIGLPGVPALSEEIMVARDIMLAKEFGRLHLAHISSAKSVALIRQAKKKKNPITCETCPHYFSLTEEAVAEYDPNAKVNPPLKTAKDVEAIIKGLKDGTIDVIATDHAPHSVEEKNVEFNAAASGLVGLETALALVLTKLVGPKKLSLKEAISKMTIVPAEILGIDKGTLKVGAEADVIIVDPAASLIVDPAKFASKGKNSPFAGMKVKGRVLYTIVGGKIIVSNGKIIS